MALRNLFGALALDATLTGGNQLAQIYDKPLNRSARVSPLRDLHVGSRQVVFYDSMADGIDTNKWTSIASGAGAIGSFTSSGGAGHISSAGSSNSGIRIVANRVPAFVSGTMIELHSSLFWPAPLANSLLRAGLCNAHSTAGGITDGAWFELTDTGLDAVVWKGGVDNFRASTGIATDGNRRTCELLLQGDSISWFADGTLVAQASGTVLSPRTGSLSLATFMESTNRGGLSTARDLATRGMSMSRRHRQEPDEGFWSYYTGTAGTVNVATGQRVVGIGAMATANGATLQINGGGLIPVLKDFGFDINPKGQLFGPATLVFTGTDMYLVEVVG